MTSGDQDTGYIKDKNDKLDNWVTNHKIITGFLMLGILLVINWFILPVDKPTLPKPVVIQDDPKFGKKTSNVVVSNENIVLPVTIESQEKTHAALAREFLIDQSCYDEKTNIWLIHSVVDVEDAVWPKGWYYEDDNKIEVLILGNGTWSITNNPDIFNVQISPDVTGLNCKTHIPHK